MTESLAGRLLVATPALTDPNFHRTVVLICLHDENGAFGLVLNRPLDDEPVVDVLPGFAEQAIAPACLFAGGPVSEDAGVALARVPAGERSRALTPVVGQVSLVSLELAAVEPLPPAATLRLFRGYAGWGGGQLEGEVQGGSWFVVESTVDDAFTPEPAHLWQRVLRRQAGRLAMFAHFPTDPRAN